MTPDPNAAGRRVHWLPHAYHAAMDRALSMRRLSVLEEEWLAAIEHQRSRAGRDSVRVSFTDFGPGDDKSEPMDSGVARSVDMGYLAGVCSMEAQKLRLLLALVRELQPANVLELGTCVGLSTAAVSAALRLNGKGQLVTLEGSPELAACARATMSSLGLGNLDVVVGPHAETLPSLSEDARRVFDFVIIDGDHREKALLTQFHHLVPMVARPCVLFVDDVEWSAGMARAWGAILASRDADVLRATTLHGVGLCALGIP